MSGDTDHSSTCLGVPEARQKRPRGPVDDVKPNRVRVRDLTEKVHKGRARRR